ncbi:hypothetical protein [Caballeronia sp. dw_276]|uniref:hypothetical protein n=1 Tax=Caballeronia sp. dw_276 TaxID=2719795 RepID=UPI001BD513EC|nr:hypothetical protein [Caballeronia sp. dw_276]
MDRLSIFFNYIPGEEHQGGIRVLIQQKSHQFSYLHCVSLLQGFRLMKVFAVASAKKSARDMSDDTCAQWNGK